MEKDRWAPNETYIITILGSNPSVISQGGKLLNSDTITKKYINYFMNSYGIFIKRLATFYKIPPKNIKILAKGTKKDFSIISLANEKLYLQLDKNSIYETEISSDELDFIYFFDDNSEARYRIDGAMTVALKDIPVESRILCFLDYHGVSSANIPLLRIYIPLLRKNALSLRLFINGYFGGSMIDLIANYFKFSDILLNQSGQKIRKIGRLKLLVQIVNEIGLIKFTKPSKGKTKTENECFQIANLNEVIQGIKQMIALGIDDTKEKSNITYFQVIFRYIEDLINSGEFENFKGNLRPISELNTVNITIIDGDESQTIQLFEHFGFKTFSDIYIFNEIMNVCPEANSAVELFSMYNEQNVNQLMKIYNGFKCKNSKEVYNVLNMFEMHNVTSISQLHSTPNDQAIFTSAFENEKSVTFGARRIKGTKNKVIFGSPAFGAFFKEVFFDITDEPISEKKIREEAVGINEEDGCLEYAAVCPSKRGHKMRTEWIRLNIEQKTYGHLTNERFFDDELIKEHLTKEEILNRIRFRLVQKFDEDCETPINKENDIFVEPVKNGKVRQRIRRSRKPIDTRRKQIQWDTEYDDYYSDDELYNDDDGNILKSSTPSGSSSATPSASESEDDMHYVTLKKREAEKIIKALNLPAASWGVDVHRFIVAALVRKSKELELYTPFDPMKENGLHNGLYDWASSFMGKYIDVCEIYDAHKLVLRISDWANDNFLVIDYDFDVIEHLIASICRLAKQCITELYQ